MVINIQMVIFPNYISILVGRITNVLKMLSPVKCQVKGHTECQFHPVACTTEVRSFAVTQLQTWQDMHELNLVKRRGYPWLYASEKPKCYAGYLRGRALVLCSCWKMFNFRDVWRHHLKPFQPIATMLSCWGKEQAHFLSKSKSDLLKVYVQRGKGGLPGSP